MAYGEFSPDERRAIQNELNRILSSPSFRRSSQCSKFLQFIVTRRLEGKQHELKERTIAVELFGKSVTADLDRDSTVRVCALHTRRRLEEFYSGGAAPGPFRIELPPGSYVPEFRRNSGDGPAGAEPAARAVPDAPARRRPLGAILAGTALLSAAAVVALIYQRTPDSLQQFWEPALGAPGGVEVLIAAPAGGSSATPGDGRSLPAPAARSAGASQATAVAEIVHFLRSRGTKVEVGDYRQIRGGEVPEKAVVVVGGSAFPDLDSRMDGCPLRLEPDADPPRFVSKSGVQWPGAGPAGNGDISYAAVYRIPPDRTRRFVLLISGTNARSSEIAATHLVRADSLEEILRSAPAGWPRSRMAVLLEMRQGRVRPVTALLW